MKGVLKILVKVSMLGIVQTADDCGAEIGDLTDDCGVEDGNSTDWVDGWGNGVVVCLGGLMEVNFGRVFEVNVL